MAKIIPIRDLKDTSKISELCHSSSEPVFITKNGYDDMVIMSSEAYNAQLSLQALHIRSEEIAVAENKITSYSAVQKYSINEIRKVLSPILSAYGVNDAILFGSYAKGTATEKSDIDLLVNSNLKGLSFFGLVNDILESLRVPADIFDIREIEKDSAMEKEIRDYGIKIYGE